MQFAIENSKISGNQRGIQHATGNQNIVLDSVGQYAHFERLRGFRVVDRCRRQI